MLAGAGPADEGTPGCQPCRRRAAGRRRWERAQRAELLELAPGCSASSRTATVRGRTVGRVDSRRLGSVEERPAGEPRCRGEIQRRGEALKLT